MSTFIDNALNDLDIFFNDLSQKTYVNGILIDIVIDHDRLKERSKKEYDGIHVGDILYYCKESDLPQMPKVGESHTLGKKIYEVFDVRKDLGLYEIILKGASS